MKRANAGDADGADRKFHGRPQRSVRWVATFILRLDCISCRQARPTVGFKFNAMRQQSAITVRATNSAGIATAWLADFERAKVEIMLLASNAPMYPKDTVLPPRVEGTAPAMATIIRPLHNVVAARQRLRRYLASMKSSSSILGGREHKERAKQSNSANQWVICILPLSPFRDFAICELLRCKKQTRGRH